MKTKPIIRAVIGAIGGFVPPYKRTNATLEKILDTSDGWIQKRTGIRERRILASELATSDMIVPAVQDLMSRTSIAYEDIDALIVATSTPDNPTPSTAHIVCEKLGLQNVFAFDINSACTGFLYALSLGRSLIESRRYKNILLVGADKMSSITDIQDRSTGILFGDGAGVVLLQRSTEEDTRGILDSLEEGDGKGVKYLNIPAGGSSLPASRSTVFHRQHYVRQNGLIVFRNSIEKMTCACRTLLEKNKMDISQVDWFVPHQANGRILSVVGKKLALEKHKILTNLEYFGNTATASIPLCLWTHRKKFRKGDLILLATFGAGFNWGAMLIRW